MKYLKLFGLFLFFQGYAKITSVEYEYYTNFGIPVSSNWILIFNKNTSYFHKYNKRGKIAKDTFKREGVFFKKF